MSEPSLSTLLRSRGIQPSAQRLAVAAYVLATDEHPSADRVWQMARERLPMVSRATVYNTLNVMVARGLLRQLVLAEGRVVFDSNLEPHHHFIDDHSGQIYDIPWEALEVKRVEHLPGFDVSAYQVVLRGRKH